MKILLTSTSLPYPPYSGGAQRTELLYRSLSEIGTVECAFLLPKLPSKHLLSYLKSRYNVKYILTTEEIINNNSYKLRYLSFLNFVFPGLLSFFLAGRYRWKPYKPATRILSDLNQYDLVVARYLQSAATFDLFRSNRLILDVDDYGPDRLKLRLGVSGLYKRFTLKREALISQRAHEDLLKRVRYAWVSNVRDQRHPGLEKAHHLPNIPFPDFLVADYSKPKPSEEEPNLLFVGSMNYSANTEAINHFIKYCWIEIIKSFPNAKLLIAGSNMTEAQVSHWGSCDRVMPLDFVEDISELYSRALVVVAPIKTGAGTNIKVLEAASFGCAIVMSSVAQRGFENHFFHEKSCLVASSDCDLIRYCCDLLSNHELAHSLGNQARIAITQHYNFDVFRKSVHRLCESVIDR